MDEYFKFIEAKVEELRAIKPIFEKAAQQEPTPFPLKSNLPELRSVIQVSLDLQQKYEQTKERRLKLEVERQLINQKLVGLKKESQTLTEQVNADEAFLKDNENLPVRLKLMGSKS